MVAHELAVADVIQKDPNVAALTHNVTTGNTGRLNIELKPRSARRLSADEVIEELRPKLSAIPGVRVYLQNPPSIRIGGIQSRSLYQYTLQDPDTSELYRVAPDFEKQMRTLPGWSM
jgi:HAE1 family hydrophobic/amphiphilic exporter-1